MEKNPRAKKIKDILLGVKPTESVSDENRNSIEIGHVIGNGNIIGSGNIVTTTAPVIRRKVEIVPGDGVITEEQAFKIKALVDKIVDFEKLLKASPRGHGAVWSAFQKRFRITSYRQLPNERFDEACKYLSNQIGRIKSMKSAPKKMGDRFRKEQIAAIQARCKEFQGGTERRKKYMTEQFGISSLTEASDEQIKTIYRHVMGWSK